MEAIIPIGCLILAAVLGVSLAIQNCKDAKRVQANLEARRAWRKKHRSHKL